MSLLARARKFTEESEALEEKRRRVEDLREQAAERGVQLSPIEQLELIDWPCAIEASLIGFIRCGHMPDRDSLMAAAALALYVVDTSEKQEKGEKPRIRYGLTADEARALLARIYLGRRVRLTDSGEVELTDG